MGRRSQAVISASLGIDRKTTRADWRELAEGWFRELVDAGLRQITWPAIEPHRDYIVEQLKAG